MDSLMIPCGYPQYWPCKNEKLFVPLHNFICDVDYVDIQDHFLAEAGRYNSSWFAISLAACKALGKDVPVVGVVAASYSAGCRYRA